MRYLRDSDYLHTITENDLTTLVEEEVNPNLLIFSCELKAQEQISMFLRKRYDLENLFEVFPEYKISTTYSSGSTVWYSEDTDSTYTSFLYTPKSATTSLPTSNSWERVDPRYTSIVDWMVTLSVYKLHERLSPDSIPKHRKESYDLVMKSLDAVQKGRVSPAFPEVENRLQTVYVGGEMTSGIGYQY